MAGLSRADVVGESFVGTERGVEAEQVDGGDTAGGRFAVLDGVDEGVLVVGDEF